MHETSDESLLYNNLFIYQVLCTLIYRRPSHYSFSLRSSDAYMRQYYIAALLQVMSCCLIGANPLSEQILPYYQFDNKEHISVAFYLKFEIFIQGNAVAYGITIMAPYRTFQVIAILFQWDYIYTGYRP